jgi:hypothetical protein
MQRDQGGHKLCGWAEILVDHDDLYASQFEQVLGRDIRLLFSFAEPWEVNANFGGRAFLRQQAFDGVVDHWKSAGDRCEADDRICAVGVLLTELVKFAKGRAIDLIFLNAITQKTSSSKEIMAGNSDHCGDKKRDQP